MTILERKVNAIARCILAHDSSAKKTALEELDQLMAGRVSVGTAREEIDAILTELGIPTRVKGYQALMESIYLGIDKKGPLSRGLVNGLYVAAAEACETTPSRLERSIRHAVELCFDRCDPDVLMYYFGNTASPNKGMLTNGEFIIRVANIVRERIGGQ